MAPNAAVDADTQACLSEGGMSTAIVHVPQTPTPLAKLDQARRMLAESRTLPQVKAVRDIAEAARVYAKAAHLSREAQNHAAEISLLASRKAGEILSRLDKDTPKQAGAKKAAASVAAPSEYRKALEDTHTPERTAEHWQHLAKVPTKVVDEYLEQARSTNADISASGLLKADARAARAANPPTIDVSPKPCRASVSDLIADLTFFQSKLTPLRSLAKNLKFDELDESEQAEVITLVRKLGELGKAVAESTQRLEAKIPAQSEATA